MGVANPQVPDASLNYASNVQKHGIALSMDKIVTLIIISAIALSLVLIFYFLFDKTSTDHFKVNVSVAMFFGSIGSFVFNKKNVPVNRR
jgi:flagellar basal body-associated protein FliL